MKRISITNLSIARGGKELYRDFCLEIQPGLTTSIIAPSGSGKTTLLSYIAGLLPEQPAQQHETAFVFQEPRLLEHCTVLENVMIPLENKLSRAEAEKTARRILGTVHLSAKLNEKAAVLSGGEKQRAAIARAFSFPSELLLLDEPFQSLDIGTKIQLMSLLKNLISEKPRTVLLATHDIDEAIVLSNRMVVMKGSPLKIMLDLSSKAPPPFQHYSAPTKNAIALKKEILDILCTE